MAEYRLMFPALSGATELEAIWKGLSCAARLALDSVFGGTFARMFLHETNDLVGNVFAGGLFDALESGR
jgi:hypothetical protein